jgi:hypothetical protein
VIRAYHFVNGSLRDGSPVPADGAWLEVDPPIKLCVRGLHASVHPLDALMYAPGNTLCLVELGGEIVESDDKCVATRRRIIARFDAEPLLRKFARDCASSVLHLWDAPQVVRDYLKTGDESLRAAAGAAAGDAAGAAAGDAAWAAAWAAAGAAAGAAAVAAARSAARTAARAAAWAAAGAVAGDAAWAAAGAAADKRLEPTVVELQASAVELLRRMCAVGRPS